MALIGLLAACVALACLICEVVWLKGRVRLLERQHAGLEAALTRSYAREDRMRQENTLYPFTVSLRQ